MAKNKTQSGGKGANAQTNESGGKNAAAPAGTVFRSDRSRLRVRVGRDFLRFRPVKLESGRVVGELHETRSHVVRQLKEHEEYGRQFTAV